MLWRFVTFSYICNVCSRCNRHRLQTRTNAKFILLPQYLYGMKKRIYLLLMIICLATTASWAKKKHVYTIEDLERYFYVCIFDAHIEQWRTAPNVPNQAPPVR